MRCSARTTRDHRWLPEEEGRVKISDKTVDMFSAIFGLLIVAAFILGLAESISSGFAGFWGGLPFWCISVIVLLMLGYDIWDSLLKKKE
jgi:hypothetical protein